MLERYHGVGNENGGLAACSGHCHLYQRLHPIRCSRGRQAIPGEPPVVRRSPESLPFCVSGLL